MYQLARLFKVTNIYIKGSEIFQLFFIKMSELGILVGTISKHFQGGHGLNSLQRVRNLTFVEDSTFHA